MKKYQIFNTPSVKYRDCTRGVCLCGCCKMKKYRDSVGEEPVLRGKTAAVLRFYPCLCDGVGQTAP